MKAKLIPAPKVVQPSDTVQLVLTVEEAKDLKNIVGNMNVNDFSEPIKRLNNNKKLNNETYDRIRNLQHNLYNVLCSI